MSGEAARPSGAQPLCPVCDSLMRPALRIFKCETCGHGWRRPGVDGVAFHAAAYRQQTQRVAGEIAEGAITPGFHAARAGIVAERLARIGKLLRPDDSALDIGGGAGTFALAVRDRVGAMEATELDPMLVAHAREAGIETRQVSLLEMDEDAAFDVVFAWHVLEHIDDVAAAARRLKRMFRRFLILEIPMGRGAPEVFDGHFHFFTDESFQRLFQGLVLRQYGAGVQAPARLAVFEKPRVQRRAMRVLKAPG